MSIIQFTWTVDGALADATSVLLSDETGAFGVKRDDTDVAVVADGTAMDHDGVGIYSYEFTDPANDLTYTYAVEVTYGGATHHLEYTKRGPVSPATDTGVKGPHAVTWEDLIEHGKRYLDDTSTTRSELYIRPAIRNALRRLATEHDWTCLVERERITINAPYTTGTVAVAEDGTVVTLTDGTFPSWANVAEITIDGAEPAYQVQSRDSGAQLTLKATTPFDTTTVVAASYSLQRVSYDVPANFRYGIQPHPELSAPLKYLPPDEWLEFRRLEPTASGDVLYYTIMDSPDTRGTMAMFVHPAIAADETFDFIFVRWPREMTTNYAEGTIAGTVDTTNITGTTTVWITTGDRNMDGAVLRIGDATNIPTGLDGQHPYLEEHYIKSTDSTTTLTLESALAATHAGASYRICDAVEFDAPVLLAALHRAIEYEIDIAHPSRNADRSGRNYYDGLNAARQANVRWRGKDYAGPQVLTRRRLADMPNEF